ncbi:ribonucleoside-diphosphate reductase subunit alpha [Candidatus Peribacteria bacterium]|nr:ribonucleoside-diphosphate reductase subunit alpha [Candidatus Peribacteria bacterium]
MPLTHIRKRSGELQLFTEEKIEAAIAKACIDTPHGLTDPTLPKRAAEHTVAALWEAYSHEPDFPTVEQIQDEVERSLMALQAYETAKSFILYRARQAEARAQAKIAALEHNRLQMITDANTVETLSHQGIQDYILAHTQHLPDCDPALILAEVERNLYDGITESEVRNALVLAAKSYLERDPAYGQLAALFLADTLYEEVMGVQCHEPGFAATYRDHLEVSIRRGIDAGRLDPRLGEFDFGVLSAALEPARDRLLRYMGMHYLWDRYVMRITDDRDRYQRTEAPQHFWMRIAMGLAINEPRDQWEHYALEFYSVMSQLHYVPSTPTLFHAGTSHPQLSSCYILTIQDDLHNIFKTNGDVAQLLKYSGGVGHSWTHLRAVGAYIKATNAYSSGIIPFLRIMNDVTVCINRAGRRRGASVAYLETWHYEIEEFLQLRKNTGDERRRTHDMNTANWIPDLFMQRVRDNGDWTLFSPDETPDLHDLYGAAFKERYEQYERDADEGKMKIWKRIKAASLWRQMVTMLFETGHPWITFKDPCNVRSPQDHVGVVHSSNLCTEITLNNSQDETAVCNLGSVNLRQHVADGQVQWEQLQRTVRTAMRLLDNVVDLNFYPTPETATSNHRHRPVGLGMMGYQDMLYSLGMRFDSEQAVTLSDEVMEYVSYYAIAESAALAAEKGAYETYPGSKWDRGIFPYDTLALLEQERGEPLLVDRTTRLDWDALKATVAQHGMRNSNCMAIAPTASIGNIAGCYPCTEPIYKNLYVKSNMGGEFTVVNEALIADLKARNLWDDEMLQQLKIHDGSVQAIDAIPAEIKAEYQEVFELGSEWILRHAAVRGKWIDQSQSVNIFYRGSSGREIAELYQLAWQMGLKTTYYLRTLGATQVEKSTVATTAHTQSRRAVPEVTQPELMPTSTHDKATMCSLINGDGCESCQ